MITDTRNDYLPREFKAQLMARQPFKAVIPLAKPLHRYRGTLGEATRLTIDLSADGRSGTMTQGSSSGDTVVKFIAKWD